MPNDPLQPVSYRLALHSTVATHLVRLAISHFFGQPHMPPSPCPLPRGEGGRGEGERAFSIQLKETHARADLVVAVPQALHALAQETWFQDLHFLLVLVPEGERLSEPLPKGPRSLDILELPLVTRDLVAVLKKGIKEGNR